MGQLVGAAVRAVLVGAVVALSAVLLPGVQPDAATGAMLVALCAAVLTLAEYGARSPGLVGFRHAPPCNRLRFGMVALALLLIGTLTGAEAHPGAFAGLVAALGAMVGAWLDVAGSPVRLLLLTLPEGATAAEVAGLRAAAGLGVLVAGLSLAAFGLGLWGTRWPARRGTFNVWLNLPTFDPGGSDVVARLARDARANVALGCLLPFLFPAALSALAPLTGPLTGAGPQTRVWVMTAWAVLPAMLVMRGVALARIARMIRALRPRDEAAAPAGLQAA